MKNSNPKRTCRYCGDTIPDHLHGNKQYCSDEHAYAAKKERSRSTYQQIKIPHNEIIKNEEILASIYKNMISLKKPVSLKDINQLGFNCGVSEKEMFEQRSKTIWKVLGAYAYHIDPSTLMVSICKPR